MRSRPSLIRFIQLALFVSISGDVFSAAAAGSSCASVFDPDFLPTNSERLRSLETDGPERQNLFRTFNRDLNEVLRASPNYKAIAKMLYRIFDKAQTVRSISLRDGTKLEIVDQGLAKPTELVRVAADGTRTTLFSNFDLKRNNSYTFTDLSISPGETHAVLFFVHKGSTDVNRLVLLDLATGAATLHAASRGSSVPEAIRADVVRDDLVSEAGPIAWLSDTSFGFKIDSHQRSEVLGVVDVRHPEIVTERTDFIPFHVSKEWSLGWAEGEYRLLRANSPFRKLEARSPQEIVGSTATHVYLRDKGPTGFGEIVRVPVEGPAKAESFVAIQGELITGASVQSDGHVFVQTRMGAARTVHVVGPDGGKVHSVVVPDCCSVSRVAWSEPGSSLSVTLQSMAVRSQTFVYDLSTSTWSDPELTRKMMTYGNIELETRVVDVRSDDGTLVPMRLTMKKGLLKDGRRPVRSESYGGFSVPGRIDPRFSPAMVEMLILKGGIHAGPAIRGGNERGPDWNAQARLETKGKTMEDLASTVDWFTRDGWSRGDRIAISGTSNGGLTVLSTGLMMARRDNQSGSRPNEANADLPARSSGRPWPSVGMVFAYNGVQDLHGKDRMDPEFGGWSYEYGPSFDPRYFDVHNRISPVEMAFSAPISPLFVPITGWNDSRVNPGHSAKAATVLKENGMPVQMLSMRNAGHWLESPTYQDLIGWRAEVVVWTLFWDRVGWRADQTEARRESADR